MKKIHLSSEKQGIIAFCTIQTLCVFIAAYCALNDAVIKTSVALTIMFLVCTVLCEIAKYKIVKQ